MHLYKAPQNPGLRASLFRGPTDAAAALMTDFSRLSAPNQEGFAVAASRKRTLEPAL